MAASLGKSYRRMESRNKHSWWWDSHVSVKNSKWLAENVEEMDQSVKRMLKLIEEEGDSFAKKAEMYYQKRPELVSHVEEFYRMYRSLAERYDNVTGELRKSIPSDLQSQGSGISDVGSEPPSRIPSPEHRLSRRQSGTRAPGFDVFLKTGGNGNSLDLGDETSTLDSESESDDSVNNYSSASATGDYRKLRKRITQLEGELRRIQMQQEENNGGSYKSMIKSDSSESLLLSKIGEYEEKIRFSEEEINKLRSKLEKYEKYESNEPHFTDLDNQQEKIETFRANYDLEELKVTKEKLVDSEEKVKRLSHELSSWKSKVDREKREVSKLLDRISRYKVNLSERDQEIRAIRETISNANKTLSDENSQLQNQITKLLKERAFLDDNIKEYDLRCQCLEEDLRRIKLANAKTEAEIELLKSEIASKDARISNLNEEMSLKDDRIDQMNEHLHQLHLEHMEVVIGIQKSNESIEEMRVKVEELEREVMRQREVIEEGAEEKREAIRQLCFSLEHYRNAYQMLRQTFVGHNKRHPVMAS